MGKVDDLGCNRLLDVVVAVSGPQSNADHLERNAQNALETVWNPLSLFLHSGCVGSSEAGEEAGEMDSPAPLGVAGTMQCDVTSCCSRE